MSEHPSIARSKTYAPTDGAHHAYPVYPIIRCLMHDEVHLRSVTGIPFTLRPFPHSPDHHTLEELRNMRIVCGWDVELVDEWLLDMKEGRRIQWTAFQGDRPIGMCALNIYSIHDETLANGEDRAEVAGMFLYPQWRSKGIGQVMMSFVEDTAAKLGKKTTTVNTRILGPSLGPYKRRGYREYKPAEVKYVLETILGLGLTPEHMAAAFLEKPAPSITRKHGLAGTTLLAQ